MTGRLTAILTALLATNALASAPPPPPPPSEASRMFSPGSNLVIVSGKATIEVPADVVTFDVSIETEDADVRKASAENVKITNAVIAALKAHGVKSEELATSDLSTSRERGSKGDALKFQVTTGLSIARAKLDDAGELLSAAIDAGATGLSTPQFSVRDESKVTNRCMDAAFADAKSKATHLAELSQRHLGRVLAVTDGSSSPFDLMYHSPGVEGGVLGGIAGFAVMPKKHSVECGVTIAFALE